MNSEESLLVCENIGWADSVIKGYLRGRNLPIWMHDDLIQEGRIGLMQAAKLFDSDKGRFRTFAYRRVTGSAQTYMRKLFGRGEPKPRRWKLREFDCVPLNMEDDERPQLYVKSCEEEVEIKDFVHKVLSSVSPLACNILTEYYLEKCTCREIGEVRGLSESRAHQLKSEALKEAKWSILKTQKLREVGL